MNNSIKLLVSRDYTNERIDVFLSNQLENLTRSFIQKLIKKKNVKINEKLILTPSTKVRENDKIIVINDYQLKERKLLPENIKLEVIYEDKDLLIINKPKGMVVHPGAGNHKNTLANALTFKYKNNLSDLNGNLRPGIVHRIDKETSGLLVIAKNNFTHSNLGAQFNNHSIKRKYLCLIWGVIRPLNGRVETLICRNKKNRQLMTVSDVRGKKAITNYKTLKVFIKKDIPKISLLECELETGRTHQIRVHIKYKGTSILGDSQYGRKNPKFKKVNKIFLEILKKIKGQALHAQTLEFIHPTKKKLVSYKTSVPKDFKKMLNLLENLNG